MFRKSINLPHFPRLFPAWLISLTVTALLWAGLTALYAVNVRQVRGSQNAVSVAKTQAMTDPLNPEPHLYLARVLWENGLAEAALAELSIAESLKGKSTALTTIQPESSSFVLGASVSPLELISVWEGRLDKVNARYAYWLGVTSQYPSYRDAYILAGISALEIGKPDDAKTLFDKAKSLDPNNEAVEALSRRIF